MDVSEATFYVWKKGYGNRGLLEIHELCQLRDENARLKRLVADLTLDRHILQEVVKKRSSSWASKRNCTMGAGLRLTERAAPTDGGVGRGETAIPVRASAYLADPRGL
jgi:hypothetical protein